MACLNTTPVGDGPPHEAALSSTDRLKVNTDAQLTSTSVQTSRRVGKQLCGYRQLKDFRVVSGLQSDGSVLQRDVIARDRHARELRETPTTNAGEFGGVHANDDQALLTVLGGPRANLRQCTKPVDAGVRPKVDEDDLALQVRRCQWR